MMLCHGLVRRRWRSAKRSMSFRTVAFHLAGFSSASCWQEWACVAFLGFPDPGLCILHMHASTCSCQLVRTSYLTALLYTQGGHKSLLHSESQQLLYLIAANLDCSIADVEDRHARTRGALKQNQGAAGMCEPGLLQYAVCLEESCRCCATR